MFRLIFLLAAFVCGVFFWQDISPVFQTATQNTDSFMLDMNSLLNKILSLVDEKEDLLDKVQDSSSTLQ